MVADIKCVFAVIAISAVRMASNRVRFDIVTRLMVVAPMLSGALAVGEALPGFRSAVFVVVPGLLALGEVLSRTGGAHAVGDCTIKKVM